VASGNSVAEKVLSLRSDANGLLTTILWGNVGINVLLTLLSNSVMAGLTAFLFSTVLITFMGEIVPQAYFSRHAMKTAALFVPILQIYRVLLYPLAKPCALILDAWLGREGIHYYREQDLKEIIRRHIEAAESDVDHVEGAGAINFLTIDDVPISEKGEPVDPDSILQLPVEGGKPVFPEFKRLQNDPLMQKVQASGHKWIVLTDFEGNVVCLLDADGFLRAAIFNTSSCDPHTYCHRPIVVTQSDLPLGDFLTCLGRDPDATGDDTIDRDAILLWGKDKRIITGADILGRLLRGIASECK
jgi:hypothetical protein